MTPTLSADATCVLQNCLALLNKQHYTEANQAFRALQTQLAIENPVAARLVELLWTELLAAQRSTTIWQQICDAERGLTEQMAASHFQLQQNYLRLMQEQ
ncbi:MAG: hypothetical protein HC881_21490 [Leptolyngbyaceae cyanobacterium SL_7_1]|nr:hypothetical protein [Leptolyngbyaceae cyanobacterium SL_7_1]